jgi:hypothetical protein
VQLPTPHTPLLQDGVPLATEQALPQAPQFARDVLRLTSHPFARLPSQLPNPAAHAVMPHCPATQLGVPPVAEQMFPQVPQLLTSVPVWVSQPLVISASQLLYPAAQVMLHVELEQAGVPWLLLQAAPQIPQLVAEVLVSISQPLDATASQSA